MLGSHLVLLCKIVLLWLHGDGGQLGPVLQPPLHQHYGIDLGVVPVALHRKKYR